MNREEALSSMTTLILLQRIIKTQGLEKTLEDINHFCNKYPAFQMILEAMPPDVVFMMWRGMFMGLEDEMPK